MILKLYSADDDFVTDLECLPFNAPPEVIVWGVRTFVLVDPGALRYREAWCWFAPNGSDGKLPFGGATQ